jgi:thioredoxin
MRKKINYLFFAALTFFIAACNNSGSGQQLDAKAFSEKIHGENNPVILDVRTPEEFSGGYITGAININYNSDEFNTKSGKLDKDETIYVYCLAGSRSSDAAKEMRKAGFKNVVELKGGILKWKAAGLEVTPGNSAPKNLISLEQYNAMINDSIPVLVDFYAPWCGPCRKLAPILEEIKNENVGKVKVIRINIEENVELAQKMNVSELPVIIVYRNNKLQNRKNTLLTKEELLKLLF